MSIRLRLTLYWTVITAVILLAAGVLILFLFSREMWGTLDAALLEEASTSAEVLANAAPGHVTLILRELSQETDLGPGRRVRLIVGGRVIFDSGGRNADLPASSTEANSGVVDGAGRRYRFAIVPVRVNGQSGWLQDGVESTQVRHAIARLRRTLLTLMPIILALCVAGGYWMSASALTPINEVTRALTRIGPRDLQRRLPGPKIDDEAGQLTEAINQLLERLERASASQRRFVSEAAHELRTPLTVLRSGLEVALQRPRGAEENRAALEQALAEVERLCAIAEDLLALARLDAEPGLECAAVDLGEIAAQASAMARTLAQAKHQTLALDARRGMVVRGNARDLRRVVLNLLDNAVKFSPESGTIEVGVSGDGPMALLSVRDDGPGIGPREMPHIFDPFYRGRGANGAGSGLGLALSREIVRLHSGIIEARNRAGGGCEIQVRLPLAPR